MDQEEKEGLDWEDLGIDTKSSTLDTLDTSYIAKDPNGGVLDNQDQPLPDHLESQPDKPERELQLYGEFECKSFISPNRIPSDPIDRRRLELKEEYVNLYVDKYVDAYLKSGMSHEAAMITMKKNYKIHHIKDEEGKTLNLNSSHFLKHPHFDLLLQNKLTSMQESGIITQKAVMSALAGIGFTSIYDVLNIKYAKNPYTEEDEVIGIDLKNPNKLHAMQKAAVKSIKLKRNKKGEISSIDVAMHDQMKALEILGDVVGVIGKGAERERELENNNYEIIDSYELTEEDQEYLDSLKSKKANPIK